MSQEKLTGIVKFFNEEKGFGFITENKTKKDYFVHVSSLGGNSLYKNDSVSFALEETPKGPKAVNVVII